MLVLERVAAWRLGGANPGRPLVDLPPQDGTTALMAASVRGHKSVVDALLRHGANVDQQNLDGHTALMFAFNGRNQVWRRTSPSAAAATAAAASAVAESRCEDVAHEPTLAHPHTP